MGGEKLRSLTEVMIDIIMRMSQVAKVRTPCTVIHVLGSLRRGSRK